jgi:3-hydroxybutyryl-CoA dehydratase
MNDLKVGDVLSGDSITVTEYHVIGFAGLTGDFNPLHVDEDYARKTGFNGRIAHGLLSLSLGLGLISQKIHGYFLYGFDKIRFISPVRLGDTITPQLTVNEMEDRDKYTLYKCTLSVIKKGGPQVLNSTIILGRMKQQ